MNRATGLALLAACLSGPASAQEQYATLLAGACQGCHGVGGLGAQGIPAIMHTQSRAAFISTMQEFRANQREATVMGRIARGYTEAELMALAALYASPEVGR